MTEEERQQLRDEIDAGISALVATRKIVYSSDPESITFLYIAASRLSSLIFTLAKDQSNGL